MNKETCLEIQAYLDGELTSDRRAAVEQLCSADREAADLRDALSNIDAALRTHESEIRLSESREFYWSQIQRRIEAAERASAATSPARPILPAWSAMFRWLVPAAGMAAVAFVLTTRDRHPSPLQGAIASSTSVEYRSDADGVTIHWIN